MATLWLALASVWASLWTGAGVQTYAIVGDAGRWNSSAHSVRDSVLKSRVRRLVLPGDNLYDPDRSYDDTWRRWAGEGLLFSIVALGNHLRSYAEEVDYFDLPGEYYTRVEDDVRFVVLNSDHAETAAEQARFFDAVMARSGEAFCFVVFHHPPVTLSAHHRWEEKREFHEAIRPLLRKHASRITAVIVGHDHLASLLTIDSLPLLVSGASMEQLPGRELHGRQAGFEVDTHYLYEGEPTWIKLDVDPVNRWTWVNFVNARTQGVDCSARLSAEGILLRDNCAR